MTLPQIVMQTSDQTIHVYRDAGRTEPALVLTVDEAYALARTLAYAAELLRLGVTPIQPNAAGVHEEPPA